MDDKRLLFRLHPDCTDITRCALPFPAILARLLTVTFVWAAMTPTSIYAAPNPATEAYDDTSIDGFVAARAAAEVCLDVTFSQTDDEIFGRWLMLRDPLRRPGTDLQRAVAARLAAYRETFERDHCKSQAAMNAQSAWLNRVAVLLPSKRKVLMEPG
jgi:hypothetical protein